MKWLERLRAKTATPTGDALTKLTKGTIVSFVSVPSGGAAVFSTPHDPSLVETRGDRISAEHVPLTRSSATGSIGGDLDRAGKQSVALRLVSLPVSYQPIWYDFDVADGEYTPGELRRAGKVPKPWGPVRHYPLP